MTPLNPAMIAAYYNISFITMQTFLLSLTGRTKLKGILEIVTSATEFETVQIRRNEAHILQRIYDRVPVKMSEPAFDSPHFKALVLLQAHFSRMQLPIDLSKDQEVIISKVLSLLSACVDVLSSEGHLNAMNAMELSQMTVQAMWDRDSPLLQIPHFDGRIVDILAKQEVKDVDDFMTAMDPSENPNQAKLVAAMGLSNRQLVEAANFTNTKYPNLELEFEALDKQDITAGQPSYLQVRVSRIVDDDEEDDEEPETEVDLEVHAPFYPGKKIQNWWLVVAEEKTKSLLAIKRVTIAKKLDAKLEYVVPTPGKKDLTLFLMADSYVGVDQSMAFSVDVAEGMDEDEDEDDDEEEE